MDRLRPSACRLIDQELLYIGDPFDDLLKQIISEPMEEHSQTREAQCKQPWESKRSGTMSCS